MTDPQVPIGQLMREGWFWADVFRDHATFIYDRLAPDQDQAIRWAYGFRQTFERLASESEQLARQAGITGPAGSYATEGGPAEPAMAGLQGTEVREYERQAQRINRGLLEAIESLRNFKQQLLQQKLDCKIKLTLGPVLLHHMVLEAEEAQRNLGRVRDQSPLPAAFEYLHHHLVWLPDAAGHAAALVGEVDGVEQRRRMTAADFQKIFDGMHIKALELYSMLKVAPRMVGALRRLNRDAMAHIDLFRQFLTELREHTEGCELLGSLAPQLADHMLREELYYTEKVLQVE